MFSKNKKPYDALNIGKNRIKEIKLNKSREYLKPGIIFLNIDINELKEVEINCKSKSKSKYKSKQINNKFFLTYDSNSNL